MFRECFEKASYPYTSSIGQEYPRQSESYASILRVTFHTLSKFAIVSLQLQIVHATRRGRKHTGKKRKLEIAKGVVNILPCNVTAWSEHASHDILTSDLDAAHISETNLGSEKVVVAA